MFESYEQAKMSILESEIHQQPQVLQHLLDEETAPVRRLVGQLRGQFQYVMIAARGSSDNAARYAQYLLGAQNHLPVALATPSLFSIYAQSPKLDGALVVGISQSGQSPDIIEVIETGHKQGRPTLAITNEANSPLAQAAEHRILLHSGIEQAIAATKTYTASLGALALFSALLANDPKRLDDLQNIPDLMQRAITGIYASLPRVERYRYMSHCTVIGRGYNYSTAFEVALKIKELTRVVAEPYSSADFRHGPIAMVRDGFPVLLIAPLGMVYRDLEGLIAELIVLDSELLIISDEPTLLEHAALALPIPSGVPEYLSPLISVIPGQLFSMALAQAKGLDPDRPSGLRKITETV